MSRFHFDSDFTAGWLRDEKGRAVMHYDFGACSTPTPEEVAMLRNALVDAPRVCDLESDLRAARAHAADLQGEVARWHEEHAQAHTWLDQQGAPNQCSAVTGVPLSVYGRMKALLDAERTRLFLVNNDELERRREAERQVSILRDRADRAEEALRISKLRNDELAARLIPEEERRKLTGDALSAEAEAAALRARVKVLERALSATSEALATHMANTRLVRSLQDSERFAAICEKELAEGESALAAGNAALSEPSPAPAAEHHCKDAFGCDPSYVCFDGSAPCSKAPAGEEPRG